MIVNIRVQVPYQQNLSFFFGNFPSSYTQQECQIEVHTVNYLVSYPIMNHLNTELNHKIQVQNFKAY